MIIKNNVGFHAKQVLLAKLLLNILAKKKIIQQCIIMNSDFVAFYVIKFDYCEQAKGIINIRLRTYIISCF